MTDIAAAAGDQAAVQSAPAFDEIFREYRSRVLGLCLHVVGNAADAEDATQETLLAVYHGLPRFRGESLLSTWIYRIALRTALRVRARRPRTAPLDFEPAREARDPALDRERSRQVHEALGRLTAEHRAVLALFSLDGLSHREIAATLGIPAGTVWSRLHLARKKLAAELDALGFQRD
jgi:RNA polymerase sigma-70 factor, ECF subfamily